MTWLRHKGYTHVLVNWSELRRLTRTYGFSPAIGYEDLHERFEGMTAAGLNLLRAFPYPTINARYVELYEVPQ